jgi:uncharacterized protein (TIGR02246 family)
MGPDRIGGLPARLSRGRRRRACEIFPWPDPSPGLPSPSPFLAVLVAALTGCMVGEQRKRTRTGLNRRARPCRSLRLERGVAETRSITTAAEGVTADDTRVRGQPDDKRAATPPTGNNREEAGMSRGTPEEVLESIVEGINTGDIDALMTLYEPEAAFATQPGSLAHGPPGIREALAGFIAMKGKLDLNVTRVLQVDDLALVIGVWSFTGTGPEGEPAELAASNADVLRRQADGSWRFVIDNPWGTD